MTWPGNLVIGSSVAYWLAADPDFDGSIVVIERDPTNTRRQRLRIPLTTDMGAESPAARLTFAKALDRVASVDKDLRLLAMAKRLRGSVR